MNAHEVADALASAKNAFVVYLSWTPQDQASDIGELNLAVNGCLSDEDLQDLYWHDRIWLNFTTEDQAFDVFDNIVGDDGPTKLNPYNGPYSVYAYVTGPSGGITTNS